MQIIGLILQGLLGLAFLGAGGSKLIGVQRMRDSFEEWRYPQWFMRVTGAVELIGAIGLIIGFFVEGIAALAGLWLAATMLGAQYTHWIRVRDNKWQPSFVLLILSLAVFAIQINELSALFTA